jgi:hypothetical protein
MRKYIPGSLLIIMSGFIYFLVSCTPGSCFEDTKSSLKATFYSDITGKPLAPDTLTVRGINNDSISYNKAPSVQPALFELNPPASSSSFLITVNGLTDTLTIWYSSYPHFISKECGYTFYHHLDSIPNDSVSLKRYKFIKGIYISNRTITNLKVENIRIFF